MSHVISPQFPMSEHDAISLLENLDRENAYLVPKIPGAWGRVAVWRLTNNLVVKSRSSRPSHDIFTMGLVASETTIPVPRVQQCLRWKNSWWLIMDYVEGVDLKDEWPSLTSDERKEVAETLSSYVQQLRNVKLSNPSIPGPIDGTGASLPCAISCCRDPLGPFDSCSKMSSWFSKRFNWFINRPHNTLFGKPSSTELGLSDCIDWDWNTLYLTHGDISLSNARRDKDGKIWLLDWVIF
ncbi:hypothetical protein PAXINDRAFT_140629, partial [Paxillus involutus ATCC 200175]